MKADILLKIADHLEHKVKDKKFDMGVWKGKNQCGTVACAIGHTYKLIPGLTLIKEYNELIPALKDDEECQYDEAIAIALDITVADAGTLFYDNAYRSNVTRHEVASKIRKFVENRKNLNKHVWIINDDHTITKAKIIEVYEDWDGDLTAYKVQNEESYLVRQQEEIYKSRQAAAKAITQKEEKAIALLEEQIKSHRIIIERCQS